MPTTLAWKRDAMLVVFAVALLCALLPAVVAHSNRRRSLVTRRRLALALGPMAAAVLALATATVLSGLLDLEWAREVPGTPG